jgi:hypothetical protein
MQGGIAIYAMLVVMLALLHVCLLAPGLPATATPEKSHTWTSSAGYIKASVTCPSRNVTCSARVTCSGYLMY